MNISDFEKKGFGTIKNCLDEKTISFLRNTVEKISDSASSSLRNNSVYGIRNLLKISPKIREFSESLVVKKLIERFLSSNAKIVRAIYFNKTPEANWKVPWHQDLTIAVKEKCEAAEFTAWTKKAGINHVQPPIEILEKMITLRFHLDDTDETNGALKVIPKSHLKGRLTAEEIQKEKLENEIQVCETAKGDCLLMKPLLLHSSSAGTSPRNRRVIHLEISAESLPGNLQWHES